MEVIQQENVYKYVLTDNTLKTQQECACQPVQITPSPITTFEFALLFVLQHQIYTETPTIGNVLKHVLQLLIYTLTIRPGYASLVVLFRNPLLQIG